jgi:hypothetical protein
MFNSNSKTNEKSSKKTKRKQKQNCTEEALGRRETQEGQERMYQ